MQSRGKDLITTMLVEDHEITRLGLKKTLEHIPKISIVAEVGDGKTAVKKAKELHPDLILMDIGLPGMDGIEATKAIKSACTAKIVVITSHDNDDDIFAGLGAGADGYCLKDVTGNQLAHAVISVMDGGLWLDPGIAKQVLQRALVGRTQERISKIQQRKISHLSERENEVLSLIVDGLSNQQIAEHLSLSIETVKVHITHILEKLGVHDRTQAAVKAMKEGLLKR